MSMFVCDECGANENTALGAFWGRAPGERRCSECATGTWHGRFPKTYTGPVAEGVPDGE